MLRYSDDGRYILQFSKTTFKTTRLGPYKTGMLPEIHNSDETDRNIVGIPEPNESVYDLYPNLRSEFIRFTDPKYKKLTLKDVKPGCNYKVEFKCNTCGHKWITILQARIGQNRGCGYCCKAIISFPEKYIYYALKQIDPDLQENYPIPDIKRSEFDMYDPILKLAIEFGNSNSHQSRQDIDERKLQHALNQNIRLIRVWQLLSEKQISKLNNDEYIVPHKSSINGIPDLDIVIDDICQQYNLDQSLIDRQSASNQAFIRTNKIPPAGESLKDQYPDLCRDWDYAKNGVIKPQMLYPRSNIRVHWKCFYCHREWQVPISWRTSAGKRLKAGCQQCSQRLSKGTLKEIPYIPGK